METTNNQLLALIAAIAINNGEVGHPARTLGFTATDFDTDLCALVSVAHQAQLFIDQRPVPQVTISSAFPPSYLTRGQSRAVTAHSGRDGIRP